MIEVKNLCKSFTRVVKDESCNKKKSKSKKLKTKKEDFLAVNDVSFTANKGEILGILGPNGAGKTTLLRMLGGILTPTSGDIEIAGYDYSINKNLAKKEIGYLSGNTKLYNRFSPRELLTTFGNLYEMDKKDIDISIENVVKIMDMEKFIDNRIENLSTGQTQRTSIARCLIHSPKIYIFDEPTLGLDVISSKSIIDFMKNEKKNGKTVLYSTHYMEEAETLCDKILMIHQGEVIAYGTPNELKNQSDVNNLRDLFIKLASERGDLVEE
ncbi:ABC transporter ATP-binding protein [Romboutsia maritimum]|uniref:ABC transporter ATP-binding protein n=1 Tax=Romboutsia maritimum TaxID=2020948 RepID=A0A371ITZ8_9FIRM|nr:ABC transporter ATP-binding protein [Romboutsia maritimum]RDY23935.1 ABC transporter ATP-binding protein [Romboutsia maritimum]